MFPQRFRTRFFVAIVPPETELPASPPAPAEIESVCFATPAVVLDDWRAGRLRVPPPVLPMLRHGAAREALDADLIDSLRRVDNEPGVRGRL